MAAVTSLEEAEEAIQALDDDSLGVVEEESTGSGGGPDNSKRCKSMFWGFWDGFRRWRVI